MSELYTTLVGIVILFFWVTIRKLIRSQQIVTPLLGWIVGISFFLVLPLTVLALNGGYEIPAYAATGRWTNVDLNDPVYIFPFMVIWVTLILTASMVYFVTPQKSMSAGYSLDWRLSVQKLRTVIIVCSVIAFIGWTIRIAMEGSIANYLSLNWYTRDDGLVEQLGHLFVLYQFVSIAVQVVLTAAVGLLTSAMLRQSSDRRYGLLLFAFFLLTLNMILTGNRIYFALFALYFLTTLIAHRYFRLLLIIILLIVPLAVTFFSAWAHVRSSLGNGNLMATIEGYAEIRAEKDNAAVSAVMDVTEGGNVMLLLYIIMDYGSRYDLLLGETYAKAVTFIIPRSIYPNKIEGFTLILGKLYSPNDETSLNATALGELYANFGLFAVLLLPIITLGVHGVSRWVTARLHRRALLSTVLCVMFMWMSRSIFSDNFLAIIFSAIIIMVFGFEKGMLIPAVRARLSPSKSSLT